jgi:hypothetical protein
MKSIKKETYDMALNLTIADIWANTSPKAESHVGEIIVSIEHQVWDLVRSLIIDQIQENSNEIN